MVENSKKLEFFMKQQYYMLLTKIDGKYYLDIPELSIIAEDADLKKAYEKMEEKRNEYFLKAIEMGMVDEIQMPAKPSFKIKKGLMDAFGPFVIKLSLIFLVGFIFLSLTASIVRFAAYEVKSVPYEIINKISAMSQDDIQKKRKLIKEALEKMKPFISEFKEVFRE